MTPITHVPAPLAGPVEHLPATFDCPFTCERYVRTQLDDGPRYLKKVEPRRHAA